MSKKEEKEKVIDQLSKNISRQTENLNRIEVDVGKYLVFELDKLNLTGNEKIYAMVVILKNIASDVVQLMKKREEE